MSQPRVWNIFFDHLVYLKTLEVFQVKGNVKSSRMKNYKLKSNWSQEILIDLAN